MGGFANERVRCTHTHTYNTQPILFLKKDTIFYTQTHMNAQTASLRDIADLVCCRIAENESSANRLSEYVALMKIEAGLKQYKQALAKAADDRNVSVDDSIATS